MIEIRIDRGIPVGGGVRETRGTIFSGSKQPRPPPGGVAPPPLALFNQNQDIGNIHNPVQIPIHRRALLG